MSAGRRLLPPLALALALLAAQPLAAQAPGEDLAALITDDDIAVTSDFRGARITITGAAPAGRAGDVVVAVRGPAEPVTVTRKRRMFGLWIDADPVAFSGAPSFFTVVSARPVHEIASARAIWELGLDPAGAAGLSGPTPPDADPAEYRAALVRLKQARGLYREQPRGLVTAGGVLFQAHVDLPANAQPGLYRAEVHLFNQGRLAASDGAPINVQRIGFERAIHDLAFRQPLLYGLLAVAMALAAGWGAAAAFRRS